MSDSLRRGLRTLLDALLAVLAAGVVDAYLLNLDATQRATLVVALTGVISAVKNGLEDRGAIPALLKAPASSGAHPVPDDHGESGIDLLFKVAALVIVVVLTVYIVRALL